MSFFIIIALGESIIITGGTFSDDAITGMRTAAFVTAFVGSVAFWWIHFLRVIRVFRETEEVPDAGRVGRLLSYATVPVIAGIIVSAVGDELRNHSPFRPHGRRLAVGDHRWPGALHRGSGIARFHHRQDRLDNQRCRLDRDCGRGAVPR